LILDQVSTKLSWLNTKFMSQYMTQSTSNSGQTWVPLLSESPSCLLGMTLQRGHHLAGRWTQVSDWFIKGDQVCSPWRPSKGGNAESWWPLARKERLTLCPKQRDRSLTHSTDPAAWNPSMQKIDTAQKRLLNLPGDLGCIPGFFSPMLGRGWVW
jgi:hypothetical protein